MTDKQDSAKSKQNEIDNTVFMGILAYLGPLVIIPYVMAKEEAFVKFHIKQGLVLLVIEAAVWMLSIMLWMLAPLFMLFNIAVLVLIVVGILRVLQKEQKELPFVGKYAKYFTF